MITTLINDLILNHRDCTRIAEGRKHGIILLTDEELSLLPAQTGGVGIRWIDKAIVRVPAEPFKLTVKSDDAEILILHGCVFDIDNDAHIGEGIVQVNFDYNYEDTGIHDYTCDNV